MSAPNSRAPELPFRPQAQRAFYLPEVTIQRLGGPVAGEIMRLLVEDQLSEGEIQQKLGISGADYITLAATHPFRRELKAQLKLREHDEKFRKTGKIRDVPPQPQKSAAQSFPASVLNVKLPVGVTPQEWALKRINQITPVAVEKLVWLMQNARQEQVQYNAATKLLGLNGIVEVEKSISVIADAEAIIRELNRRGPYKAKTPTAEDAEIVDVTTEGESSSRVDSLAAPQSSQDS